jgi:hypothetical protein
MFPSSACRAIQRTRLLQLPTERGCEPVRFLEQILAVPGATFALLLVAATMEVLGDAFFQSAVHRSLGLWRWIFLAAGGSTLSIYGLGGQPAGLGFWKAIGRICGFLLRRYADRSQAEVQSANHSPYARRWFHDCGWRRCHFFLERMRLRQ